MSFFLHISDVFNYLLFFFTQKTAYDVRISDWSSDVCSSDLKGNDQVRFEVSTRALAPDLEIMAPVRSWGMTREDAIYYAYDHDIPIAATKEKVYSIDDNLMGRAIECGEMEDPWAKPPEGVWLLTKQTATDERTVVICFAEGMPVSLDGASTTPTEVIAELHTLVASYGWGRTAMVKHPPVAITPRETNNRP